MLPKLTNLSAVLQKNASTRFRGKEKNPLNCEVIWFDFDDKKCWLQTICLARKCQIWIWRRQVRNINISDIGGDDMTVTFFKVTKMLISLFWTVGIILFKFSSQVWYNINSGDIYWKVQCRSIFHFPQHLISEDRLFFGRGYSKALVVTMLISSDPCWTFIAHSSSAPSGAPLWFFTWPPLPHMKQPVKILFKVSPLPPLSRPQSRYPLRRTGSSSWVGKPLLSWSRGLSEGGLGGNWHGGAATGATGGLE